MIQIVIALVVAAIVGGAGFVGGVKVQTAETQGWIEQAASLEAQVHQMKADGDARANRAEATAKAAVAELARVRKQSEADRVAWTKSAVDGWGAWIESERLRNTPTVGSDGEIAIAACRADAAASRGALRTVLDAAFAIRNVAVINTEQLRQLQEWVREVTK